MPSSVQPEHIPPQIRAVRALLAEETSVEPTVVRQGISLVLEHKNDRVRMTATYKLFRSQWVQTATTLEIDGQRSNIAESPEEYVRVFRGETEPTGKGLTVSALDFKGPAQVSHDTQVSKSKNLSNVRNW